jgi:hypothetical protein
MFKLAHPTIKSGDNVIIGLGDSYTQGVGAYSDSTWKANDGKISVAAHDKALIAEQYEGSWVNQICQTHLKGWVPVNFGHAGIGNRGCVKQLHLNPVGLEKANHVVVVYLLSGLERFDFVRKEFGSEEHYNFEAMWPNHWDTNSSNPELWKAYAETIYSDKFIAVELILNILEAQTYCKAHGYDFVFASAFDSRANKAWLTRTLCGLIPLLEPEHKKIINQIDWDCFLQPGGYNSFIDLLLDLDGHKDLAGGRFYGHYSKLPYPSTYITNCVHPTRRGHAVMAKQIYDFISSKYLIE